MEEENTSSALDDELEVRPEISAGLPGDTSKVHRILRGAGIDPDRLSIIFLGRPPLLRKRETPPWARRLAISFAMWLVLLSVEYSDFELPIYVNALLSLVLGLMIIQLACQVLVTTTERFAARMRWTHYLAGTVSEILSTLPEIVVIAFLVPVSPLTAFVVALATIYNNALVFSIYSYFLPRDKQGKFLMPKPITDSGSQILIAGGTLGLIMGLVMLVFSLEGHPKDAFEAVDLIVLAMILLSIFIIYIYKLLRDLEEEEDEVQSTLELTEAEIELRQDLVFKHVKKSGLPFILFLLLLGIAGSFIGGERVAQFATLAIDELGLSGIVAAIILAGFAGMSEYVILWTSHRKKEYGIALASAFGGIAQVLFLIVPFTLLSIAYYQTFVNPGHTDLPITFSAPNILLLIFLFPTLHTLAALLQKDHTMDILDTIIMFTIVGLLLLLLITYGAAV